MDELLKKTGAIRNTQASATGGGALLAAGKSNTATATGSGNSAQITSMYDAQKAGNEARLKAAYEQNRSNLEANRAKISPLYQTQANDLAVQYERNRRNANEQAAANGLNTGARSQMALAQNSAWQREHGALRGQEAEAVTEADRNITNLTNQYNSNVAANNADIEAKKTAALIDENNRQETLALNRENLDRDKAQLLAGYGDFSGYAALYGDEIANNMLNLWTAQNPDLAYNTGKIDAERYKAMTGSYPVGYTPAGGGGYEYYDPAPGNADPIGKLFDDVHKAGSAQAADKVYNNWYNSQPKEIQLLAIKNNLAGQVRSEYS